jgi:hypothetical protein
MSGLATKQQSQKIFEKLKTKQANKVRQAREHITFCLESGAACLTESVEHRSASIAARIILPGRRSRLAFTCASTARPTIETSVSISPLSGPPTSIVRAPTNKFAPLAEMAS